MSCGSQIPRVRQCSSTRATFLGTGTPPSPTDTSPFAFANKWRNTMRYPDTCLSPILWDTVRRQPSESTEQSRGRDLSNILFDQTVLKYPREVEKYSVRLRQTSPPRLLVCSSCFGMSVWGDVPTQRSRYGEPKLRGLLARANKNPRRHISSVVPKTCMTRSCKSSKVSCTTCM